MDSTAPPPNIIHDYMNVAWGFLERHGLVLLGLLVLYLVMRPTISQKLDEAKRKRSEREAKGTATAHSIAHPPHSTKTE